jgi:glycosyltransferase involved in cell wall biosynthesis
MPIRLLQIVNSLDINDVTATAAMVSQHASDAGLDVGVLSMRGNGPLATTLEESGVRICPIQPARHVGQLACQVGRQLRRFRPDIVHTWSDPANRLGRLTGVNMQVPRWIVSYRTLDYRTPWWARALDRRLSHRAEALIVNSQTGLQACRDRGLAADKLQVIVEGVAQRQRASQTQRAAVRQQLGFPTDSKLVGIVGPLVTSRWLKDAIWATDLLRVFYGHVYLIIIGDGPARWRLHRYAAQVGAQRRTRFLGERADWVQLVGSLDCLCQVDPSESLSRAVLEAMAAGVPVVATNIASHRELVTAGQTGLLVPVGDRGAMARSIYNVLEDRTLAVRLGSAAQQLVRQRNRLCDMLQAYLQLYLGSRHAALEQHLSAGAFSPTIP